MAINVPNKISFSVEPALKTQYGSALRIQDYMVLRILAQIAGKNRFILRLL